jgi:shikimate kinase
LKLLIWGVSNVGKTTIGRELSKVLNCKFYDIDEEIIKMYESIDAFQEIYPNCYDRFDEKEQIMLDIINKEKEDFIIAVSPIFSKSVTQNILFTDTKSIEIIDTPEAIYNRLILDGNDALEYKEKHKEYYMQEIKWDQTASYNFFANIPKVNINNNNIKDSVDIVYNYLNDNNYLK